MRRCFTLPSSQEIHENRQFQRHLPVFEHLDYFKSKIHFLQIAIEAESAMHFRMVYEELRGMTNRPCSSAHASAIAAVEAAINTMATAIVVLTKTGQ